MKKLNFLLVIIFFGFISTAQEYPVNTSESELKWTGKKVTGEHWGYIKIQQGIIVMDGNKITDGKFAIDMNSLNCKDLEGEWSDKLVGHLKSDDFFSVEKHPVSTLTITEPAVFKNGVAEINAKLTIKEITHPVSFKAKKDDKAFTALITVDRTKYNVKYGSGKFFENLGDNMIYDDFTLDVKIVID